MTMKPNIMKAEGARGGMVIGRTRTGKAIYAPSPGMIAGHKEKKEAARNGKEVNAAHHKRQSKLNREHHAAHDAYFQGWSGEDHKDAARIHREASEAHSGKSGWDSHHAQAHRAVANTHQALHAVHERHARVHPSDDETITKEKHRLLDYTGDGPGTKKSTMKPDVTKAQTDNKEINMSNEETVEDIFKSVLGDSTDEPTLTKCIHCEAGLTKSDLQKGLGTHFIKDDNDQPSSGGKGSVEPSRVKGGKENDDIAPLLKGEDAGDAEQLYITKSEMDAMGIDTSDIDGDSNVNHIITKGEMTRLGADQHVPYLRGKKTLLSKGIEPGVGVQGASLQIEAPLVNDMVTPQHAATPPAEIAKGGMAYGPGGGSLVEWVNNGDDEAIAKSIEINALGPGSDEPMRGRNNGLS